MNRMAAIGQHALGQAIHAPADLAMKRLLEAALAGARLERGDVLQELGRPPQARSSLDFERGESRFQSCHALSELAQVISAVLR